LCEDCYIDLLSPLKACDPWAVHSAQSTLKHSSLELTPIQQRILEVLKKNGPTDPQQLSATLDLEKEELEREIAALRHMEKIRGELRGGKRLIRLWSSPPMAP
jgi:predicted HTH transcriptional regulator